MPEFPDAPARPRVVATDLDGTIVRADGSVSARTRAALAAAEEAGALVVLATGRPARWMAPIAEATGHHGIAVCSNGALAYDLHREQVLGSQPITPDDAAKIVEALRSMADGLRFSVERVDGFGHEPDPVRPDWRAAPGAIVAAVEELVAAPTVKLLARHEDLDADEFLARAQEAVGGLGTVTRSGVDGLVEIAASGVTKATGLARLIAEHGHGPEDVVAFGDMPNDLPLLGWAGHSVAVANAHPSVLATVDEVTASVDGDGVALVLERLYGT